MLARKWLDANVSCCLALANALSNMLFYFECRPDLPPDSFQLPILSVASEENGRHLIMCSCLIWWLFLLSANFIL